MTWMPSACAVRNESVEGIMRAGKGSILGRVRGARRTEPSAHDRIAPHGFAASDTTMTLLIRSTLAGALLLAFAGCAGTYGPQSLHTGASVDDVAASLGKPTGRYPISGGGERVEYARGPYGKHTYMLDFD